MGFCTKRRVFIIFLTITILQIVTTGVRQLFDFLGPLWALILTNFLNIVFCIFGFFGGYTRRKHYLITYMVWSVLWTGWNLLILCLYIPIPQLRMYKSSVLSLGTGGFSWWETRAPGCVPDWASETQLNVTNCYFDPKVLECVQAGLQAYLAIWGLITAFSIILCPQSGLEDKFDNESIKSGDPKNRTVPAFMSLSRSRRLSNGGNNSATNSLNSRNRTNSRNSKRGTLSKSSPSKIANSAYAHLHTNVASPAIANGDPLGVLTDDKLRPMTPRKVKRRSARSIQSQRFGPGVKSQQNGSTGNPIPGSSTNGFIDRGNPSVVNTRNSLRSSTNSRRNTNQRNSKRKMNHFVSPINRLMQQQVDSETSHDEPRYPRKELGHINPVYLGPQSPLTSPPPPPRPPSARSSYSNYHPARIPLNPSNPTPNVFNLNQNVFTNQAFDNSTEYNNSLMSNNTAGFYEDEMMHYQYQQHLAQSQNHIPPVPMPMARSQPQSQGTFHPPLNNFNDHQTASSGKSTDNPTLVFPLAHSPVSQESFPMWGVAQAQVPSSSPRQSNYQNPHQPTRPYGANKLSVNSETVI